MARIRSLKPQFWDSPSTAKADLACRLLFMAMWNWADDAGRGTANLKELEAFAFPNDDIRDLPRWSRGNSATVWRNFAELFLETVQVYNVAVYVKDERKYYEISSFKDHQSKDFRPDSNRPAPNDGQIWDVASEYGLDDLAKATAVPEPSVQSAENPRLAAEIHPLDKDKDKDKDRDLKDLRDPDGSSEADPLDHVTELDFPQGTFEPIPPAKPTSANSGSEYSAEFERWWEHYPRKRGKRNAFKAWKAALKRANGDNEVLIAGAKRVAEESVGRQVKFTPYPEGWLSSDGWLDEPDPTNSATTDWNAL